MRTAHIIIALIAFPLLAADEKPNETRELLADHQTVAQLKSVEFRRCRGLTSRCPDECGHSGDFATFEIVAYLKYEKPGKYGDEKQKAFVFQIQDNHKTPRIPKELAEKVNALKPGDHVLLSWRHDYVTRKEGGGESKFPERPVTKLEKIGKEEAEKLAQEAAGE